MRRSVDLHRSRRGTADTVVNVEVVTQDTGGKEVRDLSRSRGPDPYLLGETLVFHRTNA